MHQLAWPPQQWTHLYISATQEIQGKLIQLSSAPNCILIVSRLLFLLTVLTSCNVLPKRNSFPWTQNKRRQPLQQSNPRRLMTPHRLEPQKQVRIFQTPAGMEINPLDKVKVSRYYSYPPVRVLLSIILGFSRCHPRSFEVIEKFLHPDVMLQHFVHNPLKSFCLLLYNLLMSDIGLFTS